MNNKTRIFLVLSIVIALVDGLFIYMNSVFMDEALHKSQQQEGQRLHESFDTLLAQNYVNMLSMATFIANDEEVQALFLAGKKAVKMEGGGAGGVKASVARENLLKKIGPGWKDLQKKFHVRQLHFHLGPGSTSFLRVHRPEKFGDNMDDVRFTVVDTNAEQTAKMGFETGRVYSGLRGVVPVFAWDPEMGQRVHVGALEVGTSFKMILDILDQRYDTGVGVILSREHIESAMWPDFIQQRFSEDLRKCSCIIEASSRNDFPDLIQYSPFSGMNAQGITSKQVDINDRPFIVYHFPLRDYLGHKEPNRADVGTVVFWNNAEEQMLAHSRSQLFNIIYGIFAYLFIELLLFIAFRYTIRHLENEVLRKTAELQTSEAHLKDAQRIALIGNWHWDIANNIHWWSDEIFNLYELDNREITTSYESFLTLVHPDDFTLVKERFDTALSMGGSYNFSHRVVLDNGNTKYLQQHIEVIHDENETPLKILGTVQDVSEQHESESRQKLASIVFSHAREGIAISDAHSNFVMVNSAFSAITGFSSDEVLGNKPSMLSSGRHDAGFYKEMWRVLLEKGYWTGEIWNRHKNGQIYPELMTISAVKNEHDVTENYVAFFSDITEQKAHQRHLEHVAHYDVLTGLPNGLLLTDRLEQAVIQSTRYKQKMAIVYLDLDGFKSVNDNYGHDIGDQLLMITTQRMKKCLREGDTIARIGGDEFVVVLPLLSGGDSYAPMLNRLLNAAAEPVNIKDITLSVTASLGITFYPQNNEVSIKKLLRQADQAMYQAKLAGKNRYAVFDMEQDNNIRSHHERLEVIRTALHNDEFVMYYQPKVNMRTGQVIGAEALIRWQHPEQGILSPALFLPIIEGSNLEIELGEWVINSVLSQQETWLALGYDIPTSINIGALQIQQPDFVTRLSQLLSVHPKVKPGHIELEILESSALEDLDQVSSVIQGCKDINVSFSLDDFGTGYASLTYLRQLPAKVLKIDQSFIRDMLFNSEDLAILEGILGLAKAFQRDVIAEGVECLEQGEILLQLGCELAQGYFIARPMPAEELPSWIDTWQPVPSWIKIKPYKEHELTILYAEIKLRTWVKNIEKYSQGESTVSPLLNHQECPFGLWLDGEAQNNYGKSTVLTEISTLHLQLHALAETLIINHSKNLKNTILEEINQRSSEIIQQLKKLLL